MKELLNRIVDQASAIILGKDHQIRLSIACFLARGHLLIEDVPGVGKTTLTHVLAHCLGLEYNRVQFTSDLLPADILGVSIYDQHSGEFHFRQGPIFTNILLADEINRATPKCQSALLEAMEEQQVSIENATRVLPTPFFVIATQNPNYQLGTYPLPESQLDRFMMCVTIGYPDPASERALLAGENRRDMISRIKSPLSHEQILQLQESVGRIFVSDAMLDYLQTLLAFSRSSQAFDCGLSPRAGLAIKQCAQAWALMEGRDFVLPEDVQTVLPHVVGHRLHSGRHHDDAERQQLIEQLTNLSIP